MASRHIRRTAPWRLDTLRYLAGGDGHELGRRMRAYVRELDAYAPALASALEAGDFDRLRRLSHRLVGHLAVIDHASLLSVAQQIEESAVNRDHDAALGQLAALELAAPTLRVSLLAAVPDARAG